MLLLASQPDNLTLNEVELQIQSDIIFMLDTNFVDIIDEDNKF